MDIEQELKGRVYIPELFQKVGSAKTRKDRIELLRGYAQKDDAHEHTLRCIFECIWHPEIKFDLPSGAPPYREPENVHDYDMGGNTLFKQVKKLSKMIEGSPDKIESQLKRESFLIRMLESMHPEESKILVAMKNKEKPPYRGLNEQLVREAFPDWFPKGEG